MLRVLLVVALIGGCSKHVADGGRVEIDRQGGTLIVRDTTHAIEIELTRSSPGLNLGSARGLVSCAVTAR